MRARVGGVHSWGFSTVAKAGDLIRCDLSIISGWTRPGLFPGKTFDVVRGMIHHTVFIGSDLTPGIQGGLEQRRWMSDGGREARPLLLATRRTFVGKWEESKSLLHLEKFPLNIDPQSDRRPQSTSFGEEESESASLGRGAGSSQPAGLLG